MDKTSSEKPSAKIASRLFMTIDVLKPGRQVGDIMLPWSDNQTPLGFYPVPIVTICGQEGPTVLCVGGVHGDEFEGPAALMRLIRDLKPEDVMGRIIFIPALNSPAFSALSRTSPLDGVNLNRAFPGDPLGGPTAMIADFIEQNIIPLCSGIVDLHSGGKASIFVPCALFTKTEDPELSEKNKALALAMALPVIWQLGRHNDNRSLNGAAARANIPMIAAELDGGGGVNPGITDRAEAGLKRCLKFLGVLSDAPPPPQDANQSIIEIASPHDHVLAPSRGLFDRRIAAGQRVSAGQSAGWLHFPEEPLRPSIELFIPQAGTVLAHTTRGLINRGDMLALIARDVH